MTRKTYRFFANQSDEDVGYPVLNITEVSVPPHETSVQVPAARWDECVTSGAGAAAFPQRPEVPAPPVTICTAPPGSTRNCKLNNSQNRCC